MKIDIIESPYKPATRKDVCSHLKEIVVELENKGCKFDWLTGVIPDKTDGNILLSEDDIDFKFVVDNFNIPEYINIDPSRHLIFCKKCWCSVLKKRPGQVFNSSVQPE